VRLIDFPLQSRQPPRADRLLALLDLFDSAPGPILVHCKSGSDRAGLAAALRLLHDGVAPEVARRQLSLRFGHISGSRTGVLGAVVDAYAAQLAAAPMPFRTWVEERYDPHALLAAFRAGRMQSFLADQILHRE
jgi:protein tyrosine/serine phosphatase